MPLSSGKQIDHRARKVGRKGGRMEFCSWDFIFYHKEGKERKEARTVLVLWEEKNTTRFARDTETQRVHREDSGMVQLGLKTAELREM